MASYCAVCANALAASFWRMAILRRALVGGQLIEQRAVIARIHDHGHRGVILRGGAHHGRTADIDIVHRVVVAAIGARHGGGEGIEIDGQQIDGFDVVLAHHRFVDAAPSQEAAVNLRMQGLDAAAHDFGKAGVLGHFLDGNTVAHQELGGAAGRQQLDAAFLQLARELDDAGFIGDTE